MFAKRMPPAGGLHADINLDHSQEWELYHNSLSLCSRKLRICLDELGLDYKGHHIELIETGAYDTCTPEFLKINPGGTVPVLVHRGHPVYESHEQIVYAAAQAGERGIKLLGDEGAEREEIARWIDCASIVGNPIEGSAERAGHCIPGTAIPLFAAMMQYIPYREILKGFLRHPDKRRPVLFLTLKIKGQQGLSKLPPIREVVKRCRTDLGIHLDNLEAQLQSHGKEWIMGDTLTLADISWIALMDRFMEGNWHDFFWGGSQRPAVSAYWKRWKQRPSYVRQVEEMRCPMTKKGITDVISMKNQDANYKRFLEEE